jgi:hypothetical protein
MSLYYTHLLIPIVADYRPNAVMVADFKRALIDNGYVPGNPTCGFARIQKSESRVRNVHNRATNETIVVPTPSRKSELQRPLESPSEIIGLTGEGTEYDVWVTAEGIPRQPPCNVGCVKNGAW